MNTGPASNAHFLDRLVASILTDERTRHFEATHLPDRAAILRVLNEMRSLLFPGFFGRRDLSRDSLSEHVNALAMALHADLREQVRAVLRYHETMEGAGPRTDSQRDEEALRITDAFFDRLPDVRRLLSLDVQAAYDGDPAATHTDEIIFCYPGLYAIMVHRLAHELYNLDVPLLPRMMSEYAHSVTGIDVHCGARIGESFFIDHGTGVVIGETTVIGKGCKIYQGVTLGARSFAKDDRGRVVRGAKRHPTLGNRVTVYASATILGGDTVIGDDCVIAGGVFLTRSVPAGHVVRAGSPELMLRTNPEATDYEMWGSGI